ncbi:hypothetical protein CDL15_Pgr014669 [Punica granatum]|uniref:Uncharacterized protein n=1 Tax=Punica granatum TaxID=22663 RepID=A0A218XZ82_PUNGR|nr:hypothetical protein CDL15_Pgr014669 [Punica granatum]
MSAKLLHSLVDDNPQTGCSAGMYRQLFDLQHLVTGGRIAPKRLPPVYSDFTGGNHQHTLNVRT